MAAHEWDQVFDICRGALQCSDAERGVYLDRTCGHDPGLRCRVDSVLADEALAGSFLVPPNSGNMAAWAHAALEVAGIGKRMGAYTITGVLGRGGMGIVYEAEQGEPRRKVALKVIRSMPWADDVTLSLFRREARALARLEHPGIARIYDAGRSDDGWNYFAMERVDGVPLTEYARRHNLSVRRRIELFMLVCEAVHFAHQRGVIHRDLKPSNILVDESGQPRVLDFGLARIIDSEDEQTRVTQAGGFQGTLAYASPEQARGRPEEIDARSDVYSLGVVLYELVTNRQPLDVSGLPLGEATRLICERTSPRAGAIRRELRGEVETIIGKAMEKEPGRRYAGAAALGDDIERYLRHRPILAHPPSVAYHLRKLVARHRAPAALTMALLIVLVAAPIWLGVVYARAHVAEAEARLEAKTATRTKNFLLDLFGAHEPDVEAGVPLSAEQLLERGGERALEELSDEPLVQAELLDTIGTVLRARDRIPQSVRMHEAALEARRRTLGEGHADTGMSYLRLADSYEAAERFDDARRCYERAIEVLSGVLGDMHAATAKALSGLGSHLRSGDVERAEALHRRVLEILRQVHGEEHDDTAEAMCDLAIDLRRLKRYEEAEPLYREALAVRLALFGENRVNVAHNYQSLAVLLRNVNRIEEAEENYLHAQRIYRKLLGDTHQFVANNISNLGLLYLARGEPHKAVEAYEEALAIHRNLFGSTSMNVARLLSMLGQVVRNEMRDPATALKCIQESVEIRRKLRPPDHPDYWHGEFQLAVTMFHLKRYDEVVALLAERIGENGSENVAVSMMMFGTALTEVGRPAEGVPWLEKAVKRYGTEVGPDQELVSARVALARGFYRLGRVKEAEEILVDLCAPVMAGAPGSVALDATEPRLFGRREAMELLAEVYELLGRGEEARSMRERLRSSPKHKFIRHIPK